MAAAEGLEAAALVLISYPLHPPGRPERLRTEHFPVFGLPCLFVSGRRDAFATPEEFERETAATGAGHAALRRRRPFVAQERGRGGGHRRVLGAGHRRGRRSVLGRSSGVAPGPRMENGPTDLGAPVRFVSLVEASNQIALPDRPVDRQGVLGDVRRQRSRRCGRCRHRSRVHNGRQLDGGQGRGPTRPNA